MLDFLDKYCIYLALVLVGYLAYTSWGRTPLVMLDEKESLAGEVTEALLNPTLITPVDHASPADRDPFDVSWDRYVTSSLLESMEVQAEGSEATSWSGLPLWAILCDDQGPSLALIGDEVYREGDRINATGWHLTAIMQEEVVVACGDRQTTLSLDMDPNEFSQEVDACP